MEQSAGEGVLIQPDTALDRGPAGAGARQPERRCALTREVRPVADLMRFVAGPDGMVVPDIRARLPGRGVWLLCRREVIEAAAARKLFTRGLKQKVRAPEDLAGRVCDLLARRVLERLGLARRGGGLVTGFARMEAALEAGRIAVLVEAADGAADGREKLFAAARRGGQPVRIVAPFTVEELSLAIGAENVVHAGFNPDRYADGFIADVRRLAGLRAVVPPEWTLPDWLESIGGP